MQNKPKNNLLDYLLKQKHVPKWAVSDFTLISNQSQNIPLNYYGPRSQLIFTLLDTFKSKLVHFLLIVGIGFLDTIRWWAAERKQFNKTNLASNCNIFVGSGAGSEEKLWNDYLAHSKEKAYRINQTYPGGQNGFVNVSLLSIFFSLWKNALNVVRGINGDNELIGQYKSHFLTYACMRIGSYSYYKAWWKELDKYHPNEIVFISADTPAFACADIKLKNIKYHQHGLLSRSIIFPEFSSIICLTKEEKAYLQTLLPETSISLIDRGCYINDHTNSIIIATRFTGSTDESEELVEWANQNKLRVLIRLHPAGDQTQWINKYPGATITPTNEDFNTLLKREKPLYVFSWLSTTLAEALYSNVIPVTLADKNNAVIKDMIYPFSRRTLSWPLCKDKLASSIDNKDKYSFLIKSLYDD